MMSLSALTSSGGLAGGTFSQACKCPTCNYQRSLPQPSEKVHLYNEWGRNVAAELNNKLRTLGLVGWVVKWVDWDDCSRLKGSCWGNNITDFRMKLLKDGHWLSCFVIGTENYNPTGVYMSLKEIECIKRDAATGATRQTTLHELLKNADTEFAHLGLPPDCDLTQGEDQKCFFKVQTTVVMVGEGEEANLATYGCNYQAREKPRNLTLLMTSQDTHLMDDRKKAGEYETRYLMGEFNKDTERVETFYTTTDASKRTIEQSGSETEKEALAAIKEGKACETRLGPKGGRKCAAQLLVQLPIDQRALEQRRGEVPKWSPAPKKQKLSPAPSPSPALAPADSEEFVLAAWGSSEFGPIGSGGAAMPVVLTAPAAAPAADVKMEAVEEADAEEAEDAPVDEEEGEMVQAEDCPHKNSGKEVYRSLGAAGGGDDESGYTNLGLGGMGAAAAKMDMGGLGAALPTGERGEELSNAVNCKMGRFYKGPHAGPDRGLYSNNLVPDPAGGLVTVTKTLVVTCPPDKSPTFEDVVQLIKLAHGDLQHAVNHCGGQAENLMSDLAAKLGHTTATIAPEVLQTCLETSKQVKACPASGVPEGVFD